MRKPAQELTALVLLVIVAGPSCERQKPASDSGQVPADTEPSLPANRLAGEKSPYLLQHAHNPVDWYPWGDEAFERARTENKPIFLSVGYSTCHWCHVMEKETFSKAPIAEFLNDNFVCIKVDREERPDVDAIYIAYVEATTGDAGWPMSVFLTPDGKPFFGGTYFPPESRDGMPGFLDLAKRIHDLWTTKEDEILISAETATIQIRDELVKDAAEAEVLTSEILKGAANRIRRSYDPVNGGFGGAPKFPEPGLLSFLLSQGMREGDKDLVEMVKATCDRMAAGAIHDQLGGGFSRYTVDAKWRIPHFEKMLYDNAQLLDLYLDLYLVTNDEKYAGIAHGIADYVLRDMTGPEGGFYCAEDADSEGVEGKFYLWTHDELKELLVPEEFAVVERHFGITLKGNFNNEGSNVLAIVNLSLSPDEGSLLQSAKRKMVESRSTRIRPHLDDKVLASWNGLMLGSLARAAVVLEEPGYHDAAETNLSFLKETLWYPETKTLHHRWRDGTHDKVQLLDGYAFLLDGVIQLYETTLDPSQLQFAIDLADAMVERFEDPDEGRFWRTDSKDNNLILRPKDLVDGALPSGNSVATLALLKLADITGRAHYREAGEQALRSSFRQMEHRPSSSTSMLMALAYSLGKTRQVTLLGEAEDPDTEKLIRIVHSTYQPDKVVLGVGGPVRQNISSTPSGDSSEARICIGKNCAMPTNDPEKIRNLLRVAPPDSEK